MQYNQLELRGSNVKMFRNSVSGNIFHKYNYSIQNSNSKQNNNLSYDKNQYQKAFPSTSDRFIHTNISKNNNNPFLSFGKKVALVIMDGFGDDKKDPKEYGNAVVLAEPPTYNSIMQTCPTTRLKASGLAVGLPQGQMGNSEVGHNHIGAGRVVYQDLTKINLAIKDRSFFENTEFIKAMDNAKKNNSALHLMGLVSPGGIHSHSDHLLALIDMAKEQGVKEVYVHAFLDGRDTPPKSAAKFVRKVEDKLKENGYPPVATVTGRFFVMDRDKRWERVETAYDSLVLGPNDKIYKGKNEGETAAITKAKSAIDAIQQSYKNKLTDEFVIPTVIGDENSRIKDNDSVIFINFRSDRAKEITNALTQKDFSGFKRDKTPDNLYYVCMSQYEESSKLPVAFPPIKDNKNTLSEWVSVKGLNQHKVAETEKFAHVTYFINGSIDEPFPGELRTLVPSPKVATYDLKPEMSAYEVTDETIKAIKSKEEDNSLVVVNIANPDMVGHTGNLEAAIQAIKTTDECVGKIIKAAKEEDATVVLTADHGNAEKMINKRNGKPHTAHTTNLVPFAIISPENVEINKDGQIDIKQVENDYKLKKTDVSLVNIAPTVLELMGLEKPEEMTGESLIVHKK
jgi:2,3-bisphosphoglycerate-independent phosphoglycerate mutase